MLFNSFEFVLFYMPVVFAGFFLVARYAGPTTAAMWLGLASIFFYGWWNPTFVGLLLASIAFNYLMGLWILRDHAAGARHSRLLAGLAIGANLSVLAYYKYANFFIETIDSVAGTSFSTLDVILPLGISFFTFTQIAFIVDTSRGLVKEANPIHYLLFVTYFPHLIAGPVLHHKQMMPQFQLPSVYFPNSGNILAGVLIFVIGLAKKVILADSFSEYARPVFAMAEQGETIISSLAWMGVAAYTLQIYFDFSGYSDMALGLSRMFGVALPLNFNSPYKAINIIDFWRRWHITLSQFLRDYLYVPLGGNRKGVGRRYGNLLVTMLLGGLWHGASWTFVIWGGLHGSYLMIAHAWHAVRDRFMPSKAQPAILGTIVARAITLLAVGVAWVFFRAETLDGALHLLASMFMGSNGALSRDLAVNPLPQASSLYVLALFAIGAGIVSCLPNSQELAARFKLPQDKRRPLWIGGSLAAILLLVAIGSSRGVSEFIYFNF